MSEEALASYYLGLKAYRDNIATNNTAKEEGKVETQMEIADTPQLKYHPARSRMQAIRRRNCQHHQPARDLLRRLRPRSSNQYGILTSQNGSRDFITFS